MEQQQVVLVHGLFMSGAEMAYLGSGLRAGGYRVHRFRYPSRLITPQEGAALLAKYIMGLHADPVHLVGHSLGGILIMHLFHRCADLPEGRIVLLGSPVLGSKTARRAACFTTGRFLLNQAMSGLVKAAPPWRGERPLGVIAGTRGLGVGRLLSGVAGIHDGTVSVSETEVAQADDQCCLPVSHTGMLFSRAVVRQTLTFLRRGCFERIGRS
ncbi:MAG: alpha/beta hydrolase [Gammaproteobacteria bacterium]|nr:alpha/beta hydrolase [Gammaproteobacteria bacterium]